MKVRLLGTDNNIPSDELVQGVQEQLDPVGTQGEGLGIAPIGHIVTVQGPEGVGIEVATKLTFRDSSWEQVQSVAMSTVESYLNELRSMWADNDVVVRISQIETRLLDIEGVVDIQDTTLNGNTNNIYLTDEQVPTLDGVTHL